MGQNPYLKKTMPLKSILSHFRPTFFLTYRGGGPPLSVGAESHLLYKLEHWEYHQWISHAQKPPVRPLLSQNPSTESKVRWVGGPPSQGGGPPCRVGGPPCQGGAKVVLCIS